MRKHIAEILNSRMKTDTLRSEISYKKYKRSNPIEEEIKFEKVLSNRYNSIGGWENFLYDSDLMFSCVNKILHSNKEFQKPKRKKELAVVGGS